MKQRASDVLSVGGPQKGEDEQQLRKRKIGNETPSSSSSSTGNVYNITFQNCDNTSFFLPDKKSDAA
jgi:hypothetical protein